MIIRSAPAPRSSLFLPASNPRAIAKARTLAADMIILDLEDSVKHDDKASARAAARAAVVEGFGDQLVAIRVNGAGTDWHQADILAVAGCAVDVVVVPKVESPTSVATLAESLGKPVIAMIETPRGVLDADRIASAKGVVGLLAGTNDLAYVLRLPAGRTGLALALQAIVLAARAAEIWALDGVFNALDDPDGLAAECAEGRSFGFDGKSLIHPNQIAAANLAFSPSEVEVGDARALIVAASGGAERFRDRMIEAMHVDAARRLLARAI
jgi:(3S)-malyl-CoA thioesterase